MNVIKRNSILNCFTQGSFRQQFRGALTTLAERAMSDCTACDSDTELGETAGKSIAEKSGQESVPAKKGVSWRAGPTNGNKTNKVP
ncbi:hypothetical protein Ppro_1450 [Pelobacter propionicus DSM 2379]|uniref:Uncharacterized protein n=1 Tax=Pelobacter propionicus (strain DSM 2379 / NBRC 103807 / OttBd1) TaxID=338966 RepID=A1ANZ6_PELPD|nr:hypothetical protein Ppro_1450 [Pelobacter propionicus DSM 2379]